MRLRDSGSVAFCRSVQRHVHPERSAAPGPPVCMCTGRVARASQLALRRSARHPPDSPCCLRTCSCARDRLHTSFPLKVQIFIFRTFRRRPITSSAFSIPKYCKKNFNGTFFKPLKYNAKRFLLFICGIYVQTYCKSVIKIFFYLYTSADVS